jgi:hypothetical protein
MQIGLTFEEMSKIILEHVRTKMNANVNKIEIPYHHSRTRPDYCVITHDDQVEQVPEKVEQVPVKEPAKDESWRADLA